MPPRRHGREVEHRRRAPRRRSIGLVVEGQTEAAAFRQLPRLLARCPPFDRAAVVNGIGDTADAAQVAKRVGREVAFLQRDNYKVIVCVDLESRPIAAAAFAAAISEELRLHLPTVGGMASVPVDVVVADRAFEAWLLADIACLAPANAQVPKKCFEGHMRVKSGGRSRGYHYGDDLLTQFLGRYEKTRDAQRLFARLNFDHARVPCGNGGRGSASLATFLAAVGA